MRPQHKSVSAVVVAAWWPSAKAADSSALGPLLTPFQCSGLGATWFYTEAANRQEARRVFRPPSTFVDRAQATRHLRTQNTLSPAAERSGLALQHPRSFHGYQLPVVEVNGYALPEAFVSGTD
jgi:hypothetical protein